MPIERHPRIGTILICDFDQGFKQPEMVKRRPVVVISPRISVRAGLCTVVPLSTTIPEPKMPYHAEIKLSESLPTPFDAETCWVKGDMICAVGFHRLDLPKLGKDEKGKRLYAFIVLNEQQIKQVRQCVLAALGLGGLTKHL